MDGFSMLKVLYARSFANYAKRLRLTLLDNFLNVFKENFKVIDPFKNVLSGLYGTFVPPCIFPYLLDMVANFVSYANGDTW